MKQTTDILSQIKARVAACGKGEMFAYTNLVQHTQSDLTKLTAALECAIEALDTLTMGAELEIPVGEDTFRVSNTDDLADIAESATAKINSILNGGEK